MHIYLNDEGIDRFISSHMIESTMARYSENETKISNTIKLDKLDEFEIPIPDVISNLHKPMKIRKNNGLSYAGSVKIPNKGIISVHRGTFIPSGNMNYNKHISGSSGDLQTFSNILKHSSSKANSSEKSWHDAAAPSSAKYSVLDWFDMAPPLKSNGVDHKNTTKLKKNKSSTNIGDEASIKTKLKKNKSSTNIGDETLIKSFDNKSATSLKRNCFIGDETSISKKQLKKQKSASNMILTKVDDHISTKGDLSPTDKFDIKYFQSKSVDPKSQSNILSSGVIDKINGIKNTTSLDNNETVMSKNELKKDDGTSKITLTKDIASKMTCFELADNVKQNEEFPGKGKLSRLKQALIRIKDVDNDTTLNNPLPRSQDRIIENPVILNQNMKPNSNIGLHINSEGFSESSSNNISSICVDDNKQFIDAEELPDYDKLNNLFGNNQVIDADQLPDYDRLDNLFGSQSPTHLDARDNMFRNADEIPELDRLNNLFGAQSNNHLDARESILRKMSSLLNPHGFQHMNESSDDIGSKFGMSNCQSNRG